MAYNYFPERPDESVGSWMITLLLANIPVIGFIYLLVLALGSGASPSKRNFARALFLWQIIAVIAVIVLYVVFGVAIWASLQGMN